MPDPTTSRSRLGPGATLLRLALIAAVLAAAAGAFAYTGGWFSPKRLTQQRMIAGFETVAGPHPGFRRNHAKGVCATGVFESNGNAAALSSAAVFAPGRVPVTGRIAFAGGLPFIPDAPGIVRSLALRFQPPGGPEWRTGMVNIPVFPVTTAQAFYDQLLASKPDPATGKPDPAKMAAFAGAHPEFLAAVEIIKTRPITAGFADTTYNALHTFLATNAAGAVTPVRWSAVPVQAAAAPAQGGKNDLFDALIVQVAQHPVQWRLMLTAGQPSDTTNPSLLWPAGRPQVDAGMVTLDKVQSEEDGPCTDINYDPTVLPSGLAVSDDPILSARSAAYARSFTLREGERLAKPPSAVTPNEVAIGGRS